MVSKEGKVGAQSVSILLVDDDTAWGEATAELLRRKGFSVVVAPDHRLALAELESERPVDVLIADIVMPRHVNGIALSRMARMRRAGIKVIYMTAYDVPGAEDEALGPILRKPIDGEQLASEVHRVLGA